MACSTASEKLTGSNRAWTQNAPSQLLPATHQWLQRSAAAERRASGEASTSSPAAAAGHGFRSSRCQAKRPPTSTKALQRPGAFDPFLPPPSPRPLAPAPVPRPQFLRPSKLSAPVITTLIKRCETLSELQAVFAAHSPAFNHIHISAALMHTLALAALEPTQAGGARPLRAGSGWERRGGPASPLDDSPSAAAATSGQSPGVSPSSASSQAAAAEQQQPGPDQPSRPSPPDQPPLDIASPPGASAADALLSQLFAMVPLQLEHFDVQALANTTYAMAKAGYRNTSLLESLLASVQYRMDVGLPQNISNILWGCATLGYTPDRDWLALCYDAMDDIVADFNPQDVSNVLWAFAHFELNGSSSSRSSSSTSSKSASADAGADAGAVDGTGSASSIASASDASSPLPPSAPAPALAPKKAGGKYKVPPTVIGKLLLQSFALLPRFSAQQLANCAWSLGRLGFMPPPAWNQQFLTASTFKLRGGEFSPSELCGLATGVSRLRLPVGPAWADAFYVASMQQLAHMTADETAQVLLSIGALRARPPSAWVLSFISSVTRRRQQIGPQALSSALLGVARLQRAAAAAGAGPAPGPGAPSPNGSHAAGAGSSALPLRPVVVGDAAIKAIGERNADMQFSASYPSGGAGHAGGRSESLVTSAALNGRALNGNGHGLNGSSSALNGFGHNGSSSSSSSSNGQSHAAAGWGAADRNGSKAASNGNGAAVRSLTASAAEGIGVMGRPLLFTDTGVPRDLEVQPAEYGRINGNGNGRSGNGNGNGMHAAAAVGYGNGASSSGAAGGDGRLGSWPAPTERAQDMLMTWLDEIETCMAVPDLEQQQQQEVAGDGAEQAQQRHRRRRELNSQELSNVLFAVAALGLRPERRWMQCMLAALRPCMPSLAAVPRRGAMVGWALRTLRVRPDAGWLDAFSAATGPRRLRAVGSMELSSLLSAFAGWRLKPPAPWLARFWWQSSTLLDRGLFPPRHLASLLASMTVLRLTPHALWARICCRCMAQGLAAGTYAPQLLSASARSLALLGVEPERSWARAVLAASFKCWGSFQPAHWTELVWALTKMKVFLPLEWLDRFAATTQPQLQRFSGQQLATVLWVLAKRGYQPQQHWLQAFLAASEGQLAAMTDSQLVNTVWHLNRLRVFSRGGPGEGEAGAGWVRQLARAAGARELSAEHGALMERAARVLIAGRRREVARSKGERKPAALPPPPPIRRSRAKAVAAKTSSISSSSSSSVAAQQAGPPSPPAAPQRPPPGPPHSPPHVSLQLSAADLTLEGLSSGGCCGQGRPGGPGCELHLPAGISEAAGHMQGATLDGMVSQAAVPVSVK